ncbi:MAG: aminotransferase class I/II-fold pyridoxal phosphate-dependent enzyme [Bryobacterales bacterium]|nr:aminotransferase class I/II-fold pyridoxal phosphate-dependent enzyme [Bryobacterales bacterium]
MLELTRDQMRALGHTMVEMMIEHFAGLRDKPVNVTGSRAALASLIDAPPPERGRPAGDVLDLLDKAVFSSIGHVDHPRFFAFVPSPNNFVSAMAEALAAAHNVFAGSWLEGSGPAQLELTTIDWLRQFCGLPEGAAGLFVSGGSMANLTALVVARAAKLADRPEGATIYCSDQVHSSVERGLRVLGFARGQVRKLASDENFRLSVDALARQIAADRAAGLRPFCVVANAGTTNTGAVDPLGELADLCRRQDLWLHADGAYGAAAVLCGRGRALLQGIGRVDSLALDPHKWLFQPYECGCLLVRDGALLERTFRILPDYLKDIHEGEDEVNFCDRGIQLTRNFRALKLWLSIQIFGLEAFRRAVERGFEVAEAVERLLRARERFEIVTPAQLGILTFRYQPETGDTDLFNAALARRIAEDGYLMLSTTMLRGRTVLRMCTINPRTTDEEIAGVVERIEALAAGLASE